MEPPVPLTAIHLRHLALKRRALALALAAAALLGAAPPRPSASPKPPLVTLTVTPAASTPSPSPAPAAPLYVDGQILAITAAYVVFTTGDAVRARAGLAVPRGITTGSYVRAELDSLERDVVALELEPKATVAGEIDVAKVPREYIAVTSKSAPLPAAGGEGAPGRSAVVTVTIVVHVPGNTPTSDDVYLATDRSSYSPSEIRMNRVDGSTFSTSISLPGGTALKYQFTRGTYATVERDRTGGIVPARVVAAEANSKTDDTVARWADLS